VRRLVCVGGSDAGIAAALRARELNPSWDVTVVLADAYPNYSVCGIPFWISGEVTDVTSLAHRDRATLEAHGIELLTDTLARELDMAHHRLVATGPGGGELELAWDRLVIATGANPVVPRIEGIGELTPADGVHLLHAMGDALALSRTLAEREVRRAVIIGAGYIGLEMTEALTARGIQVHLLETLPEVLPTVDPELGARVRAELVAHGVDVRTATPARRIERAASGLAVIAQGTAGGELVRLDAELVLVVTGVAPNAELAARAGIELGVRGAIRVDPAMRTNAPDVLAAGDCVITHHRLAGETYLPLGTTAHKQGRIAGENALGGERRFAGSLGTQVLRTFELVAARTGLRDPEARAVGFDPATVGIQANDHKAYYPGAEPIALRFSADRATGRVLGVQMVGRLQSAIHKRIDVAAVAIAAGVGVEDVNDLDLSYTPPLGSPWDPLQEAAQAWRREWAASATSGSA